MSDAKIFLKESIQIRDDASAVKDKCANELSIWQDKFPHRNRNTLIHHGKDMMQPMPLYYRSLFNNVEGDCYHLRQGSIGCKIFDPIFLKGKSNDMTQLYLLCDKLNHFGFKLFTDDFIKKMKVELKDAVHVATIDTFDWESIKPRKKYEKQLRGK